MRHLTFTGFSAGYPICGATWNEKSTEDVHAIYAPLVKADFRATVCAKCLQSWANSYEPDEDAPDWVKTLKATI